MSGSETTFRIKRPFGWGVVVVLDRNAQAVPEIDCDSIITATADGLVILVHHAQDVELDGFHEDDVIPLAEVEVRVHVGQRAPNPVDFTGSVSVASGTLAIGDADEEVPLSVGPGPWEVQVACTPRDHADEVEIWLYRA
jgi:hypothetical protein